MASLKNIIIEELRGVSEIVKPEEVDLSSFVMRNTLNSKIWKSEDKIDPKIRKQLLKIADDFVEFLDIPWVEVIDVTLTGSLANYNWSEYSDIDLHIIFNFQDINGCRFYYNTREYDLKWAFWVDGPERLKEMFRVMLKAPKFLANDRELHFTNIERKLFFNEYIPRVFGSPSKTGTIEMVEI